jgi:hypothetical protein
MTRLLQLNFGSIKLRNVLHVTCEQHDEHQSGLDYEPIGSHEKQSPTSVLNPQELVSGLMSTTNRRQTAEKTQPKISSTAAPSAARGGVSRERLEGRKVLTFPLPPPPPPPPPPPLLLLLLLLLLPLLLQLLHSVEDAGPLVWNGQERLSEKTNHASQFASIGARVWVIYFHRSRAVQPHLAPPSAFVIPTMTAPSLHFTQNFNVASAAAAEDYVQKMFAGGAGFVKHKESGSLFDRTSGVSPKRRAGSHSDLHPPTNLPVYEPLPSLLSVVFESLYSNHSSAATRKAPCDTPSSLRASLPKRIFKRRTIRSTSSLPAVPLLHWPRVRMQGHAVAFSSVDYVGRCS